MTIEPVNLLQWLLASACFTAALMLTPRGRLRYLAALLFLFSAHMALNAVEETGLLAGSFVITPALGLAYGPLFYLFVRDLVFSGGARRQDLAHFAPAFVAMLLVSQIAAIKFAALASFLIYSAATIRLINRYHRETAAFRSDAASIRLSWIVKVFAGFVALTLLDAIRMFTLARQSPWIESISYAAVLIGAGSLFAALIRRAILQPDYFDGLPREAAAAPLSTSIAPENAALFKHIEEIITARQLHRQPHLTLSDVASATTLTEREVSRAINSASSRTFCDYINACRIRDVCEMLKTRPDTTVLEIAFDAGFTSKSSFNAVFKRECGMTPSVYRRQITSES